MGKLANEYLEAAIGLLRRIQTEETDRIEAAAGAVAAAVAAGNRVFAFGCSHSSLAVQDLVYRAGGLMLVNPVWVPGLAGVTTRPATLTSAVEKLPGLAATVLDHTPVEAGDVLVVVSVSGRNAVPVEMAAEGRRRGLLVVGVTSAAYADLPDARLADQCEHVLDCKVAKGDAELRLSGVDQRFCSASTIANSAVLQALMAAVIERLVELGVAPPIFRSGNLPGGLAENERLLAEHRDRIFYLD